MTLNKKTKWKAIVYNGLYMEHEYFETLREAITELLEKYEHQAETTGDSVADTFFYHCKELVEVGK